MLCLIFALQPSIGLPLVLEEVNKQTREEEGNINKAAWHRGRKDGGVGGEKIDGKEED